jgi:hypothetical protein
MYDTINLKQVIYLSPTMISQVNVVVILAFSSCSQGDKCAKCGIIENAQYFTVIKQIVIDIITLQNSNLDLSFIAVLSACA